MKETELVHYNFNDLRTRIVNFHFLALGGLLFVIFKNFWVELLNKSKITFLVPTFLVPLCVCVGVCVGGGGGGRPPPVLRPSTVKASSVWDRWDTREQINDVMLKTLNSYTDSLHRYFGMQNLTFQLAALSCLHTRSGQSHDLTSVRLPFKT